MPTARIQREYVDVRQAIVRQYLNELAGAQVVTDEKGGLPDHALPGERSRTCRIAIVGMHVTVDLHGVSLVFTVHQLPFVAGGGVRVADALMLDQVGWLSRVSATRQVVWRRTQDVSRCRQLAGCVAGRTGA